MVIPKPFFSPSADAPVPWSTSTGGPASDGVELAITDWTTAATTAPVDATCGAPTVGVNGWVCSRSGDEWPMTLFCHRTAFAPPPPPPPVVTSWNSWTTMGDGGFRWRKMTAAGSIYRLGVLGFWGRYCLWLSDWQRTRLLAADLHGLRIGFSSVS